MRTALRCAWIVAIGSLLFLVGCENEPTPVDDEAAKVEQEYTLDAEPVGPEDWETISFVKGGISFKVPNRVTARESGPESMSGPEGTMSDAPEGLESIGAFAILICQPADPDDPQIVVSRVFAAPPSGPLEQELEHLRAQEREGVELLESEIIEAPLGEMIRAVRRVADDSGSVRVMEEYLHHTGSTIYSIQFSSQPGGELGDYPIAEVIETARLDARF